MGSVKHLYEVEGDNSIELTRSPYDMPGFQQPVRIEQQLCSIAQFGGTKLPHKPTKSESFDCVGKIFRHNQDEIEFWVSEAVLNKYKLKHQMKAEVFSTNCPNGDIKCTIEW